MLLVVHISKSNMQMCFIHRCLIWYKYIVQAHTSKSAFTIDIKMGMISHIQGRQSVPKSGRSEWGGARNFGVYQTTSPWTGTFCLEILGRGRKIGSAYALVDLVSLEPLSYILVMLSALDYHNSFCHSSPYFNTYLPSIMRTWYYMYIYSLS